MAYPKLSVSDGTLGVAQTLTVKSWSSQYVYDITYTCGNASETIRTRTTAQSISFTPPIDLARQNIHGSSVLIIIDLLAYNVDNDKDRNNHRSYITCSIPASVKPTCEVDIYDASGAYDMYGAYVQNLSYLDVFISAEESYDSPIALCETFVDGSKYNETEFSTVPFKSSGSVTLKTTVTDGRGRASDTVTKALTVLDYTNPAVSKLTTVRCDAEGKEDEQGEYILVTFSAKVSPLNSKNTAEYDLKYKKSTDSEWQSVTLEDLRNQYSVTDYTYIFQADTDSSYDTGITVTDNHIATKRTNNAPTDFLLMHFNVNGTAIAFGKVSEREKAIEFGVKTYDEFGAMIGNGLAAYTGDGENAIDPDTTFEHCIMTNKNTPTNDYYFIVTLFYEDKSGNRMQTAYPYNSNSKGHFYRYKSGNTWTKWKNSALDAYPVGSYYIAHHTTSPAELFGGEWHRVENRFLWAASSEDIIGLTAGEATHTLTIDEMPQHRHWGGARFSYAGSITSGSHPYAVETEEWGDSLYSDYQGGDEPHNNMPPYVNVAIWRRIA